MPYIVEGIFGVFDHDLAWGDLEEFEVSLDKFINTLYYWFTERETLRNNGTYKIKK